MSSTLLVAPKLGAASKMVIALVSFAALCTGGAVYLANYVKEHDQDLNSAIQFRAGEIVDSAFLKAPTILEPEKPEQKIEDVAPNQSPRPLPPPRPRVVEEPQESPPLAFSPLPGAEDLWSRIKSQAKPNLAILRFNDLCRGAVSIKKVAPENQTPQTTPVDVSNQNANKAAKWEEPRTEASFPVDMSRVVTVSKHIPMILENSVKSELPGKVTAQIESNVYGSHGRMILIPAGSKAVGFYEPLTEQGDTRILCVWERIITPAGINIHVGNAELADAMGRSGITGDLDNKTWERYGIPLLVSILGAGMQIGANVTLPPSNGSVAIGQLGQIQDQANSLALEMYKNNVDLKPIVTIPQGSRVFMETLKDIWFSEPVNGAAQIKEASRVAVK